MGQPWLPLLISQQGNKALRIWEKKHSQYGISTDLFCFLSSNASWCFPKLFHFPGTSEGSNRPSATGCNTYTHTHTQTHSYTHSLSRTHTQTHTHTHTHISLSLIHTNR